MGRLGLVTLALLALCGPAAASPLDPGFYAGNYRYRVTGPLARLGGRATGEATLESSGDVLTLRLGGLELRGAVMGSAMVFSVFRTRGARGALLGEDGGAELVATLTPRNRRMLIGTVTTAAGEPRGTFALFRTLRDLDYVGFDPAAVRDDDAREGLRSIFAGEEFRNGIPTKLFKMRLLPYSQQKLWAMGLAPAGGLPGRDDYARLPLGLSSFERDGAQVVNTNCFSCHAGVVAGQVVAGLPSTSFDATTQRLLTDETLGFYRGDGVASLFARPAMNAILSDEEERRFDGFLDYYETLVQPSVADAGVRGDNPGPHVIWRLLARLQKKDGSFALAPKGEASALEDRLLKNPDGSAKRLPMITPSPWWHLKYKRSSFWLADVTHLSPTTFSLNLLDELPADMEARLQRTQRHLDFARQTVAPRYPGVINEEAADRGHQIYNNKAQGCAVCHGGMSRDGRLDPRYYPDMTFNVGTDDEYSKLVRSFDPLYEKSDELFAGVEEKYFAFEGKRTAQIPESEGAYLAPPLVGVWASAPYFHNGSVPTLEQVLLPSAERAEIWERDPSPFGYDHEQVGLKHSVLSGEELDRLGASVDRESLSSTDALRFRRNYDTRGFGRSNRGHAFGLSLTEAQRRDLLEFLKRL